MPESTSAPATRAAVPATTDNGDWPAQAADTVVKVVGQVRDKTTGPAITVSRAVVYGLLAALLGLVTAILGAIALVRMLASYLPDGLPGDNTTWWAHLMIGVGFTVVGIGLWMLAWRSRRKAQAAAG